MPAPVRTALAVLVASMALAPPAAACSWVLPTPFHDFEWLDGSTLLTHDQRRLGRYDVDRRAFAPLEPMPMDASPYTAFAAAPDGRHVAFAFGQAVPPSDFGASCDTRPGQTLVRDLATGRDTVLLQGADALAASREHLAVAHAAQESLLLYPWNALGAPRPLPLQHGEGDDAFNLSVVRHLAFSPDGSKLAVVQWHATGRVFVVAVPDGRVLGAFTPASDGAFLQVAWGPDSEHLALSASPSGGNGTLELRRVAEAGLERVALYEDAVALTGMDWGPEGIVVAWTRYEHWPERPSEAGVHLFLDPPALEHRTWTYDGTAFLGDAACLPTRRGSPSARRVCSASSTGSCGEA